MQRPWGRARLGIITEQSQTEAWSRGRSARRGGQRGEWGQSQGSPGADLHGVVTEGENIIRFRFYKDDSVCGVQKERCRLVGGKAWWAPAGMRQSWLWLVLHGFSRGLWGCGGGTQLDSGHYY